MVDKDTTIRILRYAKNGFLQNGYQGTSLANICGQAGVTTGALYHRFPSKDALFRAVVEPASNELLENLICPQENVNAMCQWRKNISGLPILCSGRPFGRYDALHLW